MSTRIRSDMAPLPWSKQSARWFVSSEIDTGFLYVRPRFSAGYGRPHDLWVGVDTNPIFSVLHEACYAQGSATRWSAERLRPEFPEFDPAREDRMLFTGEMIYPWMFETYPQLRPLKEAAQILADDASWPQLYDVERLSRNTVPVAAAVYYNDMYVHREFSEETARIVPHMKLWITNQYEHNALRADGEAVVGRLLEMVRGQA